MTSRSHKGFTLVDLVAILAMLCLLMTVGCSVVAANRERSERIKCAANLRSIGQALNLYANDNRGMYPRTRYVVGNPPAFSNNNPLSSTFIPGSSMSLVNDVNGALFMLIKFADANPEQFVCPSTDDEKDSMGNQRATSRNSFSDWTTNLSYSYSNPYPDTTAANNGYRLSNSLTSGFAVAADANPGGPALAGLSYTDAPDKLRQGNSKNHLRDGQNVLYNDGSVMWTTRCFVGVNRDNIYTGRGTTPDMPLDSTDSILLPISNRPERSATPYLAIDAGIGLVVVAGVVILIVVLTRSKKKAPYPPQWQPPMPPPPWAPPPAR